MVTDPFEYARRGARRTEPDDPLVADFQRERNERLAYEIKLSPPSETVARANALARRIEVPAPIVQENLEGYQAKEQLDNAMEVFSRFGNIGAWADKDKRNAAAAAEDWENLSLMGKAWETLKATPAAVVGSLEAGMIGGGQMADDAFKGLDDFNRFVTYPIRGAMATAENAIFGTNLLDPDNNQRRVNAEFAARRAGRDALIEDARPKTDNFWAQNLLGGIESVPLTLTAFATRNPTGGTALIGSLVGASEYQKGVDAGLSGPRALQYGFTQGAIEYATEKMPVGKLISDVTKGVPFAKTFWNQLVREIPGEQAATVLQDMTEWGTLNPDKTLSEFISERPTAAAATLAATIGGVGTTTAITTAADRSARAGLKAVVRVQQSQAAKEERKFLDGLMDASGKMKLRERDPDAFRDLIKTLGADQGVEEAFISADAAQEYMQSDSYNGEFDGYDIDEAVAAGGDIIVPLDELAASDTLYQNMKDHIRLSPGGLSSFEARDFDENMAEVVESFAANIPGPDQARDTLNQSIVEKLQNAGFTPNVARQQADLLTNRYATRMARLGRELTGKEFDTVNVRQVLPESLARLQKADDLDLAINALRRARDPSVKRGKSLIEFIVDRGGINDVGGDLASMGLDKWHKEKPFRKKAIRDYDPSQGSIGGLSGEGIYGADDILTAAREAGYFPELSEDSEVDGNIMLEAIGEELRGNPRYAEAAADDVMRMAADNLGQMLDEQGIDVDTATDAEIRAALERFSSPEEGVSFEPSETAADPAMEEINNSPVPPVVEETAPVEATETAETTEAIEEPVGEQERSADQDAAQEESTAATSATIEDFGERLEGARKHYSESYQDLMDDALDLNIADHPLSKSWPEPNYLKLLEDGVDPFIVSFVRVARDEIPVKPRKGWKLKGWTEKVEMLRSMSNSLLDGSVSVETLKTKMDGARGLQPMLDTIDLYLAAGHEHSLRGISLGQASYSMYNGETFKPAKKLWTVAKRTSKGSYPKEIVAREDRQHAIDDFVKILNSGALTETKERKVKFDVYSYRGKPGYYIGKKVGRNYVDIINFETAKEARDYVKENYDELVERLEKYKDIPNHRAATNSPRVGVDHRNGADVTPEIFQETFGFRGVQFGNYVEGPRRQADLNESYDALMDMAGVLGIPAKALSLNGSLGLAFGARGKGGKNAGKAHYEPDSIVINLTKKSGAGSLAHEWFHAVDNYFSRQSGGYRYGTEGFDPGQTGVRPEVVAAFKNLMAQIKSTALAQRSQELDKRRTKAYWGTDIEMAARSFESYMIARLAEDELSNDYLANVVSEKAWGLEEGYPYPTAAEIPAIREGYDNLFNVLQTRETDSGIELYQGGNSIVIDGVERPVTNSDGNPLAQTEQGLRAFWEWFGDSKVVDADGRPLVVYHGTNAEFEAFDVQKIGSSATAEGYGFYFAENEDVAKGYERDAGSVLETYLAIASPIDSKKAAFSRKETSSLVRAAVTAEIEKYGDEIEDYRDSFLSNATDTYGSSEAAAVGEMVNILLENETAVDQIAELANIMGSKELAMRAAEAAGLTDGIRVADFQEGDGPVWLAFKPEQIKSVNNVGTFDPADARILYQSEISGNSPQGDLFSQDGGYETEIPAPERGLEDREAEPIEPRALSRDDVPTGNYAQRTEIVEENTRKLGSSKVSSVEEAAQALAYLGRGAVERFDALVTDKDGNPLAIVGATKGALSETSVFLPTLVGEAFRIEGAANIWFAHNHPSGRTELSKGDRSMSKMLATAFEGSGIKANKIFAIGGGVSGDPVWTYGDSDTGGDVSGVAKPIATGATVPVVERVYSKMETLGPPLGSWQKLKDAAPSISGGKPGIILANTANVPVAFVEIDPKEMGKLRTSGRMDSLYRAISMANPGAAFIVDDGSLSEAAGSNLAGLLNSLDVSVHDIVTIDGEALTSWRGTGKGNATQRTFKQSFNDNARGRIVFANGDQPTASATIELFRTRNLSTLLHETGHLWLEELRFDGEQAAEMDEPNARQLFADWETVKAWFKSQGHEVINGVIPVEAHEMWARGVERYLMEGKAPNRNLADIFETFKGWLISIYKVVENLKSPITPEIREVMDRLIATDEEIADAREAQRLGALFEDAATAGMAGAEFERYKQSTTDARNAASTELMRKTMGRIKRSRTKEHKQRAAAIREEVAESVDARPAFRALKLVSENPLDRNWIAEAMGEDTLSLMPRRVPPVYKEGGFNPDQLAEMNGFESGEDMVRLLVGIQQQKIKMKQAGDNRSVREAAIQEETDAILLYRYGDPFTDGSIEEEALAAVHNDLQGEVIATELRVLARSTGQRPTPYRMARDWARGRVRSGEVRLEASRSAIQRYSRAAEKAAKQATEAMLAQDKDAAFRHKQAQMVNNALITEAKAAIEEVEKAVDRMGKIAKRRTQKSVDQDYLEQAQSLLENVELRQRSQRSLDKQGQFEAWAESQIALGHDIVVPSSYEATLGKRNWSRLSVDELLGLDEAVKQIMHLGRTKQTLLDQKEKREFDAVVAEAQASMGNLKQKPPSDLMEPSLPDRMKSGIATADAALLKMETVFDWLDDGKSDGAFNRIVFQPIADAQTRENDMIADYHGRIKAAFEKVGAKTLRRWDNKFTSGSLLNRETGNPYQMKREQLISIALNTGNAGNLQRLADGYGWNEQSLRRVLNDELNAEEWAFVQEVWDIVETLWPEIEAMERRVNGVAPDKVEALPFENEHGTFRGGYFPAIYDSAKDLKTEERKGKSEDFFDSLYTRATTRASATKDRADQVKAPILLQLGVINRHLGEVIHDITHREAVMQANKFLTDRRIMEGVNSTLGPEVRQQFRPWLKHVANQWAIDKAGNEGIAKWMGKARGNTTIVGMGFRVTTILTQIAGYSNSYEFVGAGWINHGIAATAKNPIDTFNFVMEKSGEIRHRMNTIERDIRVSMADLSGKNRVSKPLTAAKRFAFHGIGYMDRVVVIPTWIGAYEKMLAAGKSETQAIQYADKAVRLSQGAGSAKDLAAVQRGTGQWGEALKLLTMFYSFMSASYNRQRTLLRDATTAKPRDIPNLMARAFFLIVVPSILPEILSMRGPDEDEDWGVWAFKKMLFFIAGPIPVVRDLAEPAWDKFAGNRAFDYQLSPIQRAGQTVANVSGDLGKIARGEETKRATRNALEAAGYLTGMVPGQLAASAQFLVDLGYGEQDPDGLAEWYEGLTKGKIKD